jgi:hypothetical protein
MRIIKMFLSISISTYAKKKIMLVYKRKKKNINYKKRIKMSRFIIIKKKFKKFKKKVRLVRIKSGRLYFRIAKLSIVENLNDKENFFKFNVKKQIIIQYNYDYSYSFYRNLVLKKRFSTIQKFFKKMVKKISLSIQNKKIYFTKKNKKNKIV